MKDELEEELEEEYIKVYEYEEEDEVYDERAKHFTHKFYNIGFILA